jgi:hypothetical protein
MKKNKNKNKFIFIFLLILYFPNFFFFRHTINYNQLLKWEEA